MKVSVLLLFGIICCAYSQQLVDKIIVDDYTLGADQNGNIQEVVFIFTSNVVPPPMSAIYTATGNPPNLLGGERDLTLTPTLASANNDIATQIFSLPPGEPNWGTSINPQTAALALIQYDGKDNSANLNPVGLGGIDFTGGGLNTGFRFDAQTDLPCSYNFSIYTSASRVCTFLFSIQSGRKNVTVPFSTFTHGCDFTNVGAVTIELEGNVDVQTALFSIAIQGTVPSGTPTPTRTRSPVFSVSNSPIPPSSSRTRTPAPIPSGTGTPTPIPSHLCMCHCPAFTCQLIFDPDDDENNAFYFDDDDAGPGGNNAVLSNSSSALVAGLLSLLFIALI